MEVFDWRDGEIEFTRWAVLFPGGSQDLGGIKIMVSKWAHVRFPGFSVQRVLWVKDRSEFLIAKDANDRLFGLKVVDLGSEERIQRFLAVRHRLRDLTSCPGFTPLLDFGVAEAHLGWQAMALADDERSIPEAARSDEYQPLTLTSWITTRGPVSTDLLLQWGATMADAIGLLHAEGWVHRDIKPSNILFIQGQPCLADYELVGAPGWEEDLTGTEGFKPLEGTNHFRGDLFALGKTLYMAWTGGDRLEFPGAAWLQISHPNRDPAARRLRDAIEGACRTHPNRELTTMEEFKNVLLGRERPTRTHRRRWIVTSLGLAAVGVASFTLSRLASRERQPLAVWRRYGPSKPDLLDWNGGAESVDWQKRTLWSLKAERLYYSLRSLNLDTLEIRSWNLDQAPTLGSRTFVRPDTGELLAVEGSLGALLRIHPTEGRLVKISPSGNDELHFSRAFYWNSITGRLGAFGGYGYFRARNDRHELDVQQGRWIRIESKESAPQPWPRLDCLPMVPDPAGNRVFLCGGAGNPSGIQAEQVPYLRRFDGHFYCLDDVWELDLRSGAWKQLLPYGHFEPNQMVLAAYHPALNGLIFMSNDPGHITPPSTWVLRPGIDIRPVQIPSKGESPGPGRMYAWGIDPMDQELFVASRSGFFRMQLEIGVG